MGAWGVLAFDNDTANDWAYDLADTTDLSRVETAFADVESVGPGYLDQDVACIALGACEVVVRLKGRRGYANAYTDKVDRWVASHPVMVPDSLTRRGSAAIDRILGDGSELRELWEESDDAEAWRAAVVDLRTRLI